MIDLVLVGLISIGVFSLFVFVAIREGAINKRLRSYERTIDALHKEIFTMKKEIKERPSASIEMNEKFATSGEFETFTNIIIQKLRSLQLDSEQFKEAVFERLKHDEAREKLSQTLPPPQSTTIADEQKIISMFESGFSLEDIARQLRVHVGEIEFVLKLNNVRTRSLF